MHITRILFHRGYLVRIILFYRVHMSTSEKDSHSLLDY